MGAAASRRSGGHAPSADVVFASPEDCAACGQPCAALANMEIDMDDVMEGSAREYGKHIGICTGERTWPEKVDKSHAYAIALRTALDAHARKLPYEFIVTLLDEPTQKWTGDWAAGGQAAPWPSDECMDLVLFPDMLRFRLVSLEQLPAFAKCLIEQLASAGTPDGLKLGDKLTFLPDVPVEVVSGTYVVVCIHRQRDKRCGVAGSLLLDAFDEARHTLGVADRVHLVGTSHIGGHKFAGTCIMYPTADWFGRLVPTDAETVLRELICKGRVVRPNWRGRPPVVRTTEAAHATTPVTTTTPTNPQADEQ